MGALVYDNRVGEKGVGDRMRGWNLEGAEASTQSLYLLITQIKGGTKIKRQPA